MHQSSLENMQKCLERYLATSDLMSKETISVLDVGGADVNGSYSDLFPNSKFKYLGADLNPGPGVSVVLDDPNIIPLEDSSIDVVISGQMLEHCPTFWLVFAEMMRVLNDDGLLILIAPSAGPIHRYPVDCYRFYPDAYTTLAKLNECHLVDCWLDTRGPWKDLVGVFSKTSREKQIAGLQSTGLFSIFNNYEPRPSENLDAVKGEMPYTEFLDVVHKSFEPSSYLEIGVRNGHSLGLVNCVGVGVDPEPADNIPARDNTRIVRQTSDDFFELAEDSILAGPIDLFFIDGMHRFEYVLRDFMNAERYSHSFSAIIIDDVCPNTVEQANRNRESQVWAGDVWKIIDVLKRYRPDLDLRLIDTRPTGSLLVSNLNPQNDVLWDNYNPITREALNPNLIPDANIFERHNAFSPSDEAIVQLLKTLRSNRPALATI